MVLGVILSVLNAVDFLYVKTRDQVLMFGPTGQHPTVLMPYFFDGCKTGYGQSVFRPEFILAVVVLSDSAVLHF